MSDSSSPTHPKSIYPSISSLYLPIRMLQAQHLRHRVGRAPPLSRDEPLHALRRLHAPVAALSSTRYGGRKLRRPSLSSHSPTALSFNSRAHAPQAPASRRPSVRSGFLALSSESFGDARSSVRTIMTVVCELWPRRHGARAGSAAALHLHIVRLQIEWCLMLSALPFLILFLLRARANREKMVGEGRWAQDRAHGVGPAQHGKTCIGSRQAQRQPFISLRSSPLHVRQKLTWKSRRECLSARSGCLHTCTGLGCV